MRVLKDLASFDQATRGGQKGILVLLWHLKARNLLASSGALVMLVMAFVDSFTQQLLQYFNCNTVLGNAQASIPRTNFLAGLGSTSLYNGAGSVSVPHPGKPALIPASTPLAGRSISSV
jgi:hypothetical protein